MASGPVEAMMLKETKASLPVMAGEQELSVTLTITWEIDNTKLPGPRLPLEHLEKAN